MVIRQIPESDWQEVATPIEICVISITPEQFSSSYAIEFFDTEEDGFGACKHAVVEVQGVPYWLTSYVQISPAQKPIAVYVRSYEQDTQVALESLLNGLGLLEDVVMWRNPQLGPAAWCLFKNTENGREKLMRFQERASAEWVRMKLNKQSETNDNGYDVCEI